MKSFIDDVVKQYATEKLNQSYALASMWGNIAAFNPGKDNPYHNNRHMLRMAGIAVYLFRNSDEYALMEIEVQELRELILFLACLWHDYGHSAGVKPDVENIQYAIAAFEMWWEHNWMSFSPARPEDTTDKFRAVLVEKVTTTIRVTEFPFVHEPTTLEQRCIRDADLLYTFDTNTGEIVHGLYLELKKAGKFPKGFSFMQFMSKQAEFLDGCEHFTTLGQTIHAAMKDEVLAEQFAWAESQGFA